MWKFGRKVGLSFEIDYGDGRVEQIQFGASIHITKKNEVVFQLKNREGKDLGMSVSFTQTFLKNNARLFLRLKKMDKESRIEGGITIPW